MKNRGAIIKKLLLAGLLVFAGVNMSFASVNLYAAEAKQKPVQKQMTWLRVTMKKRLQRKSEKRI